MSQKLIFAESFKSDTLDFQNGEYRRSFERKDQPFEVTDEEWKTLKRTGLFEQVKEAGPQETESGSQADNTEQADSTQQSNDEQPPAAPKRERKATQNNQQSENK